MTADGIEPASPPLPTWTYLPFHAPPTGIITSIRISESDVGRLVTAIRQASAPDFSRSVLAEVTCACGRVAPVRSAQAVSARARAGAASASATPAAIRNGFMSCLSPTVR